VIRSGVWIDRATERIEELRLGGFPRAQCLERILQQVTMPGRTREERVLRRADIGHDARLVEHPNRRSALRVQHRAHLVSRVLVESKRHEALIDLVLRALHEILVRVLGCAVWTGNASYPLYMDDLSFSNSMTTEHNVMGPGVIGHILRNRSINPATYGVTDRWFHYDQVGSVLSESDNSGALAQTHWQDAFGNTLSGWQTATWGGDRLGWHHNSKEYDGDSQLVYLYQRWYSPELGLFQSSAPYPPMMEHRFSFGSHSPISARDPDGRRVVVDSKSPHKDVLLGYLQCISTDMAILGHVELIELMNDPNTLITITDHITTGQDTGSHFAGQMSDGNIYISMNLNPRSAVNDDGDVVSRPNPDSPFEVELAHELYHAIDLMYKPLVRPPFR